MSWQLFIDDERNPKTAGNWIIARSMEEAIDLIANHGMPSFISFDHDLGQKDGKILPTGYDFAHYLVNADMDGKISLDEDFKFFVHSANPQGAANIQNLLDRYLRFKRES